MTFDDVLLNLSSTAIGSRELDADVYEHVFGCAVKRPPVTQQVGGWVYREAGRWASMGHLTTDLSDSVSFAACRINPIGPIVLKAATMISNRGNRVFTNSFPVVLMYLLVLAKVGTERRTVRRSTDIAAADPTFGSVVVLHP